MPYNVDDIVQFAATRDTSRLQDALGDVLAQKAADAIQYRKELVGKSFTDNPEEDNEEEDDE
jgi:hypothetical protein